MGSNLVTTQAAECGPECLRYEAGHRVCAELVREAWESAAEFVRGEVREIDGLECSFASVDGPTVHLWRHAAWTDVVTVGQKAEWHPRLELVRVATGPGTWSVHSALPIRAG